MVIILVLIAALAILGPLFGKDSRDGRDWTPGDFQRRFRSRPEPPRSSGSPAPQAEARAAADRRPTVPAAC